MRFRSRSGWRCTTLSPRSKSGLWGVVVGAGLSLVLVATPLWLVGGGSATPAAAGPAPLSALSTMPAESPQFDISDLLDGDWAGEMCDDTGESVAMHFEFAHDQDDQVYYSLTLDGAVHSEGMLGSGACDVNGEDIAFHAFLAVLSDCDGACGVDRTYEGHFEDGALVGSYSDAVNDEVCRSCVGGGTWWLAREATPEELNI